MLTGRRFQVEFTDEQAKFAERIGGACRAVWNTGLEQRREYRRRGARMNYQLQAKELADAKCEHLWLKDVPSHCLQQTLMDLDRACRQRATWKVRWRSGRRWAASFRFPERQQDRRGEAQSPPRPHQMPKLGWVKFRMTRSLAGETMRSANVTREGRHWFVSVLVDDSRKPPETHQTPGTAAVAVLEAVSQPEQDPGRSGRSAGAGTAPPTQLLRAERSPARHHQRSGGDRRSEDPQHASYGERNTRQSRSQRESQVRAQARHPGQGMASVRVGTVFDSPLHRDRGDHSAGGVHVATLLSLWARGPEIPREPSSVPVHPLRTYRACGCQRRQEHPGRRACGHRL